ncbi:uncharacterized protein KZ484_021497 [Pholidichthys leucotaenia]
MVTTILDELFEVPSSSAATKSSSSHKLSQPKPSPKNDEASSSATHQDRVPKMPFPKCSKEQTKPLEKNSSKSSISKPPISISAQAKKSPTSNLATKTKILASKEHNLSTEQIGKPIKKDSETLKKKMSVRKRASNSNSMEKNSSKAPQNVILIPTQTQHSLTPDLKATEQGQMQQQTVRSSDEATVEMKTAESVETVTKHEDTGTAGKVELMTKVDTTAFRPFSVVPFMTVGEMMDTQLTNKTIKHISIKNEWAIRANWKRLVMLLENLPKYGGSQYTENDLANVLIPFGFEYKTENIYVFPGKQLAFVKMNDRKKVVELLTKPQLCFEGFKLNLKFSTKIPSLAPLVFYKSLMKLVRFKKINIGNPIIYICNISPRAIEDLREVVKKTCSIKNFLPLLNKVFIQFVSTDDAARLEVWYSHLKESFDYTVTRLNVAQKQGIATSHAVPSSMPVSMTNNPKASAGVPGGNIAPFWVTMKTSPYLFPTGYPCFGLPNYWAVDESLFDILKDNTTTFSTIMLTGLPEENYRHEDVAKLVWDYFPEPNLHFLNMNILVLPLQRRAFVVFPNGTLCSLFVRHHINKAIFLGRKNVSIHVVDMHLGCTPELIYRDLIRWSNAPVPDLNSLEHQLLCVEISETSLKLISTVAGVVGSNFPFQQFLPLANRIYFEMDNARAVTQAVEKIASMDLLSTHQIWSKVQRVESLNNLKWRLKVSWNMTVNLDAPTAPSAVQSGAQLGAKPSSHVSTPALASSSTSAESTITTRTSPSIESAHAIKETLDKQGEKNTASTTVPQTSGDAEKVEVKKEGSETVSITLTDENTVAASSSTCLVKSKKNIEELQDVKQDDQEIFTQDGKINSEDEKVTNTESESHLLEHKAGIKDLLNLINFTRNSNRPVASPNSASVTNTVGSAPSASVSVDTSDPCGQKAQMSMTRFLTKELHTSSPYLPAVEMTVETHPHKEESQPQENSEPKSDQEVLGEGATSKSTHLEPTQVHGPDQSQVSHDKISQAFDGVEDQGISCPREGSELETISSLQVLDCPTKSQLAVVVKEISHLHEEGSSTTKDLLMQDVIDGVDSSHENAVEDATNKNNALDEHRSRAPRISRDETKELYRDAGLIQSDQDQPFENRDNKVVSTDCSEQEAFELLDSFDEDSGTDGEGQNLGEMSKEEETHKIIDDEQLTPMEIADREEMVRRVYRPTRSTSCKKEKKILDRKVKYERRRVRKDKSIDEFTEEAVCEIVDSFDKELSQDATATSDRRSARENKEERKTLTTDSPLPTITSCTTRSTREKMESSSKKGVSNEKVRREEEVPTRKRPTHVRDSQKQMISRTVKTDEKAPSQESISKQQNEDIKVATCVILDTAKDGQLETVEKPKRGRPRKESKAAKKQSELKDDPSSCGGSDPKRSCSQSPCATDDLELPPFNPNTPIGQEYVLEKFLFFCNLCSVFYAHEKNAKEVHCCSRKHYDNLQMRGITVAK